MTTAKWPAPSRGCSWARVRVAGFGWKVHGEPAPEALEGGGGEWGSAGCGVRGGGHARKQHGSWGPSRPLGAQPPGRAAVSGTGQSHPVRRRWAEEVPGGGSAPC